MISSGWVVHFPSNISTFLLFAVIRSDEGLFRIYFDVENGKKTKGNRGSAVALSFVCRI